MVSYVLFGALAQLGERYTGSVEVSGSIPLCSTKKRQSVKADCLFSYPMIISAGLFENGVNEQYLNMPQ